MNTIKIITLILFSLSFYVQEIDFLRYAQLHTKNTHVRAKQLKIDVDMRIDSIDAVPGAPELDSLKPLYKIMLNKEFKIIHQMPDYSDRIATFDQNIDTLLIMDKKFCIQELLHDTNYYEPNIRNLLLLKEKNRTYLVVSFLYLGGKYEYFHEILLFDVTKKDSVFAITNKGCNMVFVAGNDFIGDFNQDGIIDFCFLSFNEEYDKDVIKHWNTFIYVYNVANNEMIKLKNYHISLNRNIYSHTYRTFDVEWFFPLKEHPPKQEFKFIKNKNRLYPYDVHLP